VILELPDPFTDAGDTVEVMVQAAEDSDVDPEALSHPAGNHRCVTRMGRIHLEHRQRPACWFLEEQDRAVCGVREHEMLPPARGRPEGHGPDNISRRRADALDLTRHPAYRPGVDRGGLLLAPVAVLAVPLSGAAPGMVGFAALCSLCGLNPGSRYAAQLVAAGT
jgi:hypothetical protein